MSRRATTTLLNQLLRPGAQILLACLCFSARAQTNGWTWIGGSSTGGQPGTYGTLGTPDASNIPGSRDSAVIWTDSSGHLWLFGGLGNDAAGDANLLNDLWEFNAALGAHGEWTWTGGSSTIGSDCDQYGTCGRPGVYGTFGAPAATNTPGGREFAVTWIDSSGHLWLFGGYGSDRTGRNIGELNDLWEFSAALGAHGEWTWMGGSSTVKENSGQPGVYGTLGVPDSKNIPGGRYGAVSWTGSNGHLWLFGGAGFDANGNEGDLNDLWEFNPALGAHGEWTWMGGGSFTAGNCQYVFCDWPAVYGTLGTSAAGNIPGGRYGAVSLTDSKGNCWLFGGYGFDTNGTYGYLNDLWEFNPALGAHGEWAWMGGSSTTLGNSGQPGVYGRLGTPAHGNTPGGREWTTSWADLNGRLWLFGGFGFDANGIDGDLNDLWEFNPALGAHGEWTWMGGSETVGSDYGWPGVYGTLGVPDSDNIPGSRLGAISWTDSKGKFWLFGGGGFDANRNNNYLNDLWVYQPPPVLKAAQVITFPKPVSPVTYGVKPIALSATATSDLAVRFTVLSGPATLNAAALTITGAGTVMVAANQSGNSDYAAAAQVKRSITVDKGKLTVTAANLSMKQGAAVPTLTYKMTGFVDSDTQIKATTGQPKLTTTATSKSKPGNYPITATAGTLAAKNYGFGFVDGTLLVTK